MVNYINLGSMNVGRRIVPFAFSQDTVILYQDNFKKDLGQEMQDVAELEPYGMDLLKIEKVCWQILWVHAKTSNNNIPKFPTWWKKHRHISAFPLMLELSDRMGKEDVLSL